MKKIADIQRRYGLTGISLNLFCKCMKFIGLNVSFWSLYVLYIDKLQKSTSMPFRELHLSDFEKQHKINSEWFTDDKLRDMQKGFSIEGNISYGYYEGEVLACYGWISLKQWGLNDTLLMNDDVLFWDAYTHPNFRGRGLFKHFLLFSALKSVEYEKKRALTQTASYNRASCISKERIGFVRLTRFVEYQLGKGRKRTTLKYGE